MEDGKEYKNVKMEPAANGGIVLSYTECTPPRKGEESKARRYDDEYKDKKEIFTKEQHQEATARFHELNGTAPDKEEEEEPEQEEEDEKESGDEDGMEEKPTALPGGGDNRLPHEVDSED